ncbi:glycosyltransferase family 2 protein [Dyella sp. ASV21]|uniref:glycosyltransferase family 2 protein n=1 Tax=Dyella sp. ASV21 TaxID=2795114 RepID=UPI0018EE2943|nr:glycosyltransferase family 2 protein [Dyella sp. ASV21]
MSINAQDVARQQSPALAIALPRAAANDSRLRRWHHLSVRFKFTLTLSLSIGWAVCLFHLTQHWVRQLGALEGSLLAHLMMVVIAILPGAMNAFFFVGLLLDRRPPRSRFADSDYPGVTLLIAAYNEETSILSTLESIDRQSYPGPLEVLVINDGSTDDTMGRLRSVSYPWLHVIDLKCNGGKAKALNNGLRHAAYPVTVTLDASAYLYRDALRRLVERFMSDPPNTAAVAGTVMVRNSRQSLVTQLQEWDYFHGVAASKRLQSLFQGTLVAQSALSLYRTDILRVVGGWPECAGEDTVLTWAILRDAHRVGYCEDAIAFTRVPSTLDALVNRRRRASRGLYEAFKAHGILLLQPRMSTLFVWWSLLLPTVQLAYTLLLVPCLLLACAGVWSLAAPIVLLTLPVALLANGLMYLIQSRMYRAQGLTVRRNRLGLLLYTVLYGLVLRPGGAIGHASGLLKRYRSW